MQATGIIVAHGVDGAYQAETYIVNIFLPDGVAFIAQTVTKGNMGDCDVLIGMSVINQGDFAVTNHNGKTCFSFCIPSRRQIDFAAEINMHNTIASQSGNRNTNRNKPHRKRR